MQANMMPFQNCLPGTSSQSACTGEVCPKTSKEQPMFTAKQVVMLCERLWKEREEKLREDYDQVLHERLSGMNILQY